MGRAGVHHHDRARVGGRDPADQLGLLAGQLEEVAIPALGLPVVVGADDHHGCVGLHRQGLGLADEVLLHHGDDAQGRAGEDHGVAVRVLEHDLHGFAGAQLDLLDDLAGAHAEEGVAARAFAFGCVEDDPAVQQHPSAPALHQAQLVDTARARP